MLQLLQCVLRSRIDISVAGVAVDEEVRLAGMAIGGGGIVLPSEIGVECNPKRRCCTGPIATAMGPSALIRAWLPRAQEGAAAAVTGRGGPNRACSEVGG